MRIPLVTALAAANLTAATTAALAPALIEAV